MDESFEIDDSYRADSTCSSIEINETIDGSGVIEDSIVDLSVTLESSTGEVTSDNHRNSMVASDADATSDEETDKSLETSSFGEPSDVYEELSPIAKNASSVKLSTSSEVHKASSKLETSDFDLSGNELDSSKASTGKGKQSSHVKALISSEARETSSKFETSEFDLSGNELDSSKASTAKGKQLSSVKVLPSPGVREASSKFETSEFDISDITTSPYPPTTKGNQLSNVKPTTSSGARETSSKFETSDFEISGNEAYSSKQSTTKGKQLSNVKLPTSSGVREVSRKLETFGISDDQSDSSKQSAEVYSISDSDSDDYPKSKADAINISDDSFDVADIKPTIKYETGVKMEPGVKLEQGAKPKSFNLVQPVLKFQSGVKWESSTSIDNAEWDRVGKTESVGQSSNPPPRLNGLQLLDDVKPIHLGKTGMETFNNQQSMALSCMKTLCESLDKKPKDDEMADNPKQLKIELMPHQRTALTWMLWREEQRPKGGILADDMGLGKTMSMISLIVKKRYMAEPEEEDQSSDDSGDDEGAATSSKSSWIAKGSRANSYYYGGTLIVCPASIMDQWKAEVKNRLKSNALTVNLHHGSNRETMARRLCKHDMVVTTYGIVSSECDNQGALYSIKWERIILDEAHIIRNHSSKQSIACCKLKGSARWALTGTPIQNREADLFPLLKFLRCRPFDDYSSFKMWISKSSTKSQERLNQVLQALLLRRTKEDLKSIGQIESLPEKTKEIVSVKLTTEEMNVYQKVLIYSQSLFAQFLHQKETRSNFTVESNSDRKNEWAQLHQQISRAHGGNDAVSAHHILILILRLRQVCIHPSLIHAMLSDGEFEAGDSDTENVPEVDLLEQFSKLQVGSQDDDDETVSKATSKVLLKSNPVFDEMRVSSKFQKIIEYISERLIGTGDKGIVVSQFASVLNMFGDHLKQLGIRFVTLTGQTKIDTRHDIVTNFNSANSSVQVMLLSLTAGGVGLNLVGANHLFFVDPHWNPQLESQAQDRIYRMGQKKPVTIYKFLCDDTIERRIQHLQDKKLEIADQVLTGAKRQPSKLTLDDMKTLFDL